MRTYKPFVSTAVGLAALIASACSLTGGPQTRPTGSKSSPAASVVATSLQVDGKPAKLHGNLTAVKGGVLAIHTVGVEQTLEKLTKGEYDIIFSLVSNVGLPLKEGFGSDGAIVQSISLFTLSPDGTPMAWRWTGPSFSGGKIHTPASPGNTALQILGSIDVLRGVLKADRLVGREYNKTEKAFVRNIENDIKSIRLDFAVDFPKKDVELPPVPGSTLAPSPATSTPSPTPTTLVTNSSPVPGASATPTAVPTATPTPIPGSGCTRETPTGNPIKGGENLGAYAGLLLPENFSSYKTEAEITTAIKMRDGSAEWECFQKFYGAAVKVYQGKK